MFRKPAKLVAFNASDGVAIADVAVCGDADDVFVDDKRRRVYVSCGEGFIDVFAQRGTSYDRIDHIATSAVAEETDQHRGACR